MSITPILSTSPTFGSTPGLGTHTFPCSHGSINQCPQSLMATQLLPSRGDTHLSPGRAPPCAGVGPEAEARWRILMAVCPWLSRCRVPWQSEAPFLWQNPEIIILSTGGFKRISAPKTCRLTHGSVPTRGGKAAALTREVAEMTGRPPGPALTTTSWV